MSRALILTGGGARAAYQVGVLKGIASILPRSVYNPFPIICGTSAGAINALSIAGRAGPLDCALKNWRPFGTICMLAMFIAQTFGA